MTYVGFYTVPATSDVDIRSLIEILKPVSSGHELIRLGPEGDGGYLVPDDLQGIIACFSAGVDQIVGFEIDCAELGMDVYMADYSVDEPPESHDRFHFLKKYVGATTYGDFITFDDWVDPLLDNREGDLLLQVDIEGFEYEVFTAVSDQLLKRSRIVVIEFHNLHLLWNSPLYHSRRRVFEKLLQTHTCVHLHPNNNLKPVIKGDIIIPNVMEFTFLRNDRVTNGYPVKKFPHPLDRDNTRNPSLPLPSCWYD